MITQGSKMFHQWLKSVELQKDVCGLNCCLAALYKSFKALHGNNNKKNEIKSTITYDIVQIDKFSEVT